jgi:hypothetical protein
MNKVMLKLILFWIVAISGRAYSAEGVLFVVPSYQSSGCGFENPTFWQRSVLDLMDEVRMTQDLPFDVSISNWNTTCFERGIKRLEARFWDKEDGLTHLHVVPLFMSSHSYEIEMHKYIFGKSGVRPLDFPEARKINFKGQITYHPALDYREQLSWVLERRAHSLVKTSMSQGYPVFRQKLILVMRGGVSDNDDLKWIEMGNRYVNDIAVRFPGIEVNVVSLREEADFDVRNQAYQSLRDEVFDATFKNKKTMILPLALSSGELDNSIHDALKGLQYVWYGHGLLPDPILPTYLIDYLQTIFRNQPVL